jgi:hypothetical protein
LSALFSQGGDPSLYVVDAKGEVALKPVAVKSYESNDVVITGGVDEGAKCRARRAEARSGPEGQGRLVIVVLSSSGETQSSTPSPQPSPARSLDISDFALRNDDETGEKCALQSFGLGGQPSRADSVPDRALGAPASSPISGSAAPKIRSSPSRW